MPVLSETKQLLPFRRRLVFCNQIVITYPFETDDLLTDFANFIIASRTAGLACSVRVEVSRAAGLAPFSVSKSVVAVATVAAVAAFFSPLSNELHVPALL